MAIAYFPSADQFDAIELALVKPSGEQALFRLLVDSGFTGQSALVLPTKLSDFAHASAPASHGAGAIQGALDRVVVSFVLPAISHSGLAVAILADISGLALPDGVAGVVGLQFLRGFRRWGAEKNEAGAWRFFLETDAT